MRDIFRGILGEVFGILADYFRRLQQRGILLDFDADHAARAFLGALFADVHGLSFFFEERADLRRRERFAAEFVRLFVRGTLRKHAAATGRGKPAGRRSVAKAGPQRRTAQT